MSTEANLVEQSRSLGRALKEAREQAGLDQDDVTQEMEWAPSRLANLEEGLESIAISELKGLLLQYRVTDPSQINNFVELAKATKMTTWWQKYRNIYSKKFLIFLEAEDFATDTKHFQKDVFPGLLQTSEYAWPLVHIGIDDPERVDLGVQVRLHRKKMLLSKEKTFSYILDEVVLHRIHATPEILRNQLIHLKKIAALPNVSIRVLPFSKSKAGYGWGSFDLLIFPNGKFNKFLVLEFKSHDEIVEKLSETEKYANKFAELENDSLSEQESFALIEHKIAQLA